MFAADSTIKTNNNINGSDKDILKSRTSSDTSCILQSKGGIPTDRHAGKSERRVKNTFSK